MTVKYVCTELIDTTCTTWEELAQPAPFFPEISKADADSITLSILGILVLAWGWRQLRSLIK